MVTAKKMALSGLWGRLQKDQSVYMDCDEAVPTTFVDATEPAREVTKMMRKNVPLSDRNTGIKVELVEARAAKSTMHEQLTTAKCRITAFKTQLADPHLTLEKLARKMPTAKADL